MFRTDRTGRTDKNRTGRKPQKPAYEKSPLSRTPGGDFYKPPENGGRRESDEQDQMLSNSFTISASGSFVRRLTTMIRTQLTRKEGSSS